MWHKINSLKELTRFKFRVFYLLDDCHTEVKELGLPNYLPIIEVRIVGLISFLGVLALSDMQIA